MLRCYAHLLRVGPAGHPLEESLATRGERGVTAYPPFNRFEALPLGRTHSRERNVKPVLMDLSIIRFRAN